MWIHQQTLDNVYDFSEKGSWDHAFTEVVTSSNKGVFPHKGIICNMYNGCVIHLHEFIFYLIYFRLPLNDFEVGILNHLKISHSQLHPVRRTYVKVF